VAKEAGRLALMLGRLPSEVLGLDGPKLERFIFDVRILAEVLRDVGRG